MQSRGSVSERTDSNKGETGGRVLIVSNRLPVTAKLRGGALRLCPSDGGLATGLRQVARRWPAIWVGWYGLADVSAESVEAARPQDGGAMVAVALSATEVSRFYRRYCNSLLWPVLHGFIEEPAVDREDWLTYRAVNERYAEAVLQHLRPGDRVWVHDYHLFLLPSLLRNRQPEVPIAVFVHTPFPEPKVFAAIPESTALLEGLLGANVVGFHTESYAANFLAAVRSLGYPMDGSDVLVGDHRVSVRARPMGIDVDTFTRLGSDLAVLSEVPWIRAVPGMRASSGSLLLGVDRLDYTKGIPQRLLAFECLLERHPELHGRVSLLQVAVPSREEIGAYRDLREKVMALVERINRSYRKRNWTPVTFLFGTVDLNTLASLYRAADVMVVTALRHGLNLVAKEFIATRVDENGVLILSKYAGAAAELKSAVVVNPNHVGDLAEAYYRALRMPATERRQRMRALRRVIASNHIIDWAAEFLDHLRDRGRSTGRRHGGRGTAERGLLGGGPAWRAPGPASDLLPGH